MTAPSIKEALELLPCPFCGKKPIVWNGGEPDHMTIGCNNEDCPVDICSVSIPGKEKILDAWNTRATLQPSGERREAIARIIAEHIEVSDATLEASGGVAAINGINDAADAILASGFVPPDPTTSKKEVVGNERREAIIAAVRTALLDYQGTGSFAERALERDLIAAEVADRLASVLVQAEAGWRDISTAPKDKIDGIIARRVLLANTHGSMFIGYWSAGYECWQDTSTHARIFSAATHWMPLPAPPIRSARNGGEG